MSKPTQSESARVAAGRSRLTLRVSSETVTKLDELRLDPGSAAAIGWRPTPGKAISPWGRSEYIEHMVAAVHQLYASVAVGTNPALKPAKTPAPCVFCGLPPECKCSSLPPPVRHVVKGL